MNITLVRNLAIMIPIFLLSACNLQNRLLYYPARTTPTERHLQARDLHFWPSASGEYRGFISTKPNEDGKDVVIVFHGNAETAWERFYYAQKLASSGRRVLLAEYPGYGKRTGKLGEASFVRDAADTIGLAYREFGGKIFLLGESLGCGVAAAAAKNSPVPIEGLILITPWDTLQAVAREKFPWLPVSLFLRDKYDTVKNLKAFPGRIAVIAAERDEIIPMDHAERLYEALPPGNKRMWTIEGARHNDWAAAVDDAWWKEVVGFIEGKKTNGR